MKTGNVIAIFDPEDAKRSACASDGLQRLQTIQAGLFAPCNQGSSHCTLARTDEEQQLLQQLPGCSASIQTSVDRGETACVFKVDLLCRTGMDVKCAKAIAPKLGDSATGLLSAAVAVLPGHLETAARNLFSH